MPLGYALAVALVVVGVILVARAVGLSRLARVAWILVIVMIPVLGPITWFIVHAIQKRSLREDTVSYR